MKKIIWKHQAQIWRLLYFFSQFLYIVVIFAISSTKFQFYAVCYSHIFHVPFVLFSLVCVVFVKTEVIACVASRTAQNGAPKRFQLMENHPRSVQAVQLLLQQPIAIQLIFQPPNSVQHFWHRPIGHLSRNYLKLVVVIFSIRILLKFKNWSNFPPSNTTPTNRIVRVKQSACYSKKWAPKRLHWA